jgi:L-alanine-DL-glutamate epimerase-like enolase superfamily enzyme
LIRERFAPRILAAPAADLIGEDGATIDPSRVWRCMMTGEKPGGHGERSVAVGTLDMAIWDAAAKIAGLPLYRFLAARLGRKLPKRPKVAVYAGGGYPYPSDDITRLRDEVSGFLAAGFTHVKIKIGAGPLAEDMKRIEAVLALLPAADRLAVDAMNRFDGAHGLAVAAALAPLGLWWFEDICDPLDFESLAAAKQRYGRPVAAGEALFSLAEAKLLSRYGGLRPAQDILLFDPAQSYGLTHYLEIVAFFEAEGWPRSAFWPHGGHLFSLQVAAALGLGGSEVNPLAFQPFGGLMDGADVSGGQVGLPEAPGIGLESKEGLWDLFKRTLC